MKSSALVPQPPLKPIIGHLMEVLGPSPLAKMMDLARTYGPVYWFEVFGQGYYVVSGQALVDEVCDESRFQKSVHQSLLELRPAIGDGLFTAFSNEPNWAKAHRVLMQSFGPLSIWSMFDKMVDIADQMFLYWERFGPETAVDVSDHMTRLTLDTIALCAFDCRFNSFYREDQHPFVDAMVNTLSEAGKRELRPKLVSKLMLNRSRKFDADIELMRSLATKMIEDRRKNPHDNEEAMDLLDRMLNGVDPVTGEKLDDENIVFQMITFLIAGHETTSGLLSFATYFLLKNPDVLQRARDMVDEVVGNDTPRIEHLARLRYIEQILMETLRIWPTAPAFAVTPLADTTFGGKYPVSPNDIIMILTPMLHRDVSVWGEDVEAFRPERFEPENAEKLPPNSWKPFGNGARACIGRPFAMQEAHLVLIMLLQRFDFSFADPNYELQVAETLTLKPTGLRINVRPRARGVRKVSNDNLRVRASIETPNVDQAPAVSDKDASKMLVLFGGNTGSSESFARRIAGDAGRHGFHATCAPLDAFAGKIDGFPAIVVVTASYEGQPPDNAISFLPYIEAMSEGALGGVKFSVLGCGNKQWARTYQAIPKRVDAAFEKAGATRVHARGELDSGGDFFGEFDRWYAELWNRFAISFGKDTSVAQNNNTALNVSFLNNVREKLLSVDDMTHATVIDNRELVDISAPGSRSKKHMELKLPETMTYRSGDYLAVLPRNSKRNVDRVLRRFRLSWDTQVVIDGTSSNPRLPLGQAISCGELLSSYVELAVPATRSQVSILATATRCPPEKVDLERLSTGDFECEILEKRTTVMDLLERFGSVDLSFDKFLDMLPALKARQYSISSSPLWKADHVTLTVAVVDAPALSGNGRHEGVASSYLARLDAGDSVSVSVRPSNARFRPPAESNLPMILICAGSGIAPFRGFLQERAIQKQRGENVGPSLLFFGIDDPDVDFLYRDELEEWANLGVVEVMPAYSNRPEEGARFVQDKVWLEREKIAALFAQGATVYVCGDGKNMAPAVRATLGRIYQDSTGANDESAHAWIDTMEREHGRYVADVFA
ncbi:cytochrome [Burkholderia stagnalis]|uniref:Bifunctional cytochrome P450/NADPH--P450 reductase n=1 Tax=Burkholderia stagnalis TaxID=1503054 RepID=A0A6L3MVW5_9BURK|nr:MULTISPECIES: cytochrome P450 [Burkholderia cepacia complex]KAB0636040.1 cytochrome P450 [Burkholderia stagnalis]KAB1597288.1 cytochrome P450 [Burkholderia cepacia]KUY77836.1 cytochrome [Burkholderia cepacia]KVA25228.1 cytochrome [Burkholderia cepacia]KVA45431.1 cytochrome [Burkholderia cepacia]